MQRLHSSTSLVLPLRQTERAMQTWQRQSPQHAQQMQPGCHRAQHPDPLPEVVPAQSGQCTMRSTMRE
eukprot:11316899-Alexandrium_andersonii.AAC.1